MEFNKIWKTRRPLDKIQWNLKNTLPTRWNLMKFEKHVAHWMEFNEIWKNVAHWMKFNELWKTRRPRDGI